MPIAATFTLPAPRLVADGFRTTGLVCMTDVVTAEGKEFLSHALTELSDRQFRRELLMPQSGGSPRRMTVIGGEATNQHPLLMKLYRDPDLLRWCSQVAGVRVAECPNLVENVIFSVLEQPGDTHGWHLDDYPIAFIVVLETPADASAGGQLQIGSPARPETVGLASGDVYLMRSDLIHHHVSPLAGPHRRVIANFTYAWHGVPVQENGSADLLCAQHPPERVPST